jgi:hypothetical protein
MRVLLQCAGSLRRNVWATKDSKLLLVNIASYTGYAHFEPPSYSQTFHVGTLDLSTNKVSRGEPAAELLLPTPNPSPYPAGTLGCK